MGGRTGSRRSRHPTMGGRTGSYRSSHHSMGGRTGRRRSIHPIMGSKTSGRCPDRHQDPTSGRRICQRRLRLRTATLSRSTPWGNPTVRARAPMRHTTRGSPTAWVRNTRMWTARDASPWAADFPGPRCRSSSTPLGRNSRARSNHGSGTSNRSGSDTTTATCRRTNRPRIRMWMHGWLACGKAESPCPPGAAAVDVVVVVPATAAGPLSTPQRPSSAKGVEGLRVESIRGMRLGTTPASSMDSAAKVALGSALPAKMANAAAKVALDSTPPTTMAKVPGKMCTRASSKNPIRKKCSQRGIASRRLRHSCIACALPRQHSGT
mmetsp:Transcript_93309/g.263377  ORF Transcript_93309/g.263377 Transcript_93309/m.263377 type:complete len:322 (-) Transcript_93309:1720-2685(-)